MCAWPCYRRSFLKANFIGFAGIFLWLLFCIPLHRLHAEVQFAPGAIIRGFEYPQTDSEGRLQAKIKGEQVVVVSINEMRIQGLSIDLYDTKNQMSQTAQPNTATASNPSPTVQLNAPSSIFWRIEKRLVSEEGVEIIRPGFKLKADSMRWSLAENRGIFEKNVRVTLSPEFLYLYNK